MNLAKTVQNSAHLPLSSLDEASRPCTPRLTEDNVDPLLPQSLQFLSPRSLDNAFDSFVPHNADLA